MTNENKPTIIISLDEAVSIVKLIDHAQTNGGFRSWNFSNYAFALRQKLTESTNEILTEMKAQQEETGEE